MSREQNRDEVSRDSSTGAGRPGGDTGSRSSLGFASLPSTAVDDSDVPTAVDVAGSIGIALGAVSIVLAVVGLLAGWLRVQPLANVAIVFSLLSIGIAMVCGMLFQAYALDWSRVRR
ncbi:hypothetical protein [Natronobacterium gregoryi]|uniref:Uncharacterized protein n=2 Tax=Natronobacterium gregoryi TaxID=44930 RepID=L0AFX6_NATGS|nr:hypothetical protein [Natronobacterium gregoryi]AFZ72052.1 hypothetical protein Natgr_0811 [Natronobacterium gregoryi SP2]ELY62776.1 hypothetical protein C490_17212 [Natronobacterium gregoryi SP2]PLK20900.1 hypothetical protein CYV19_07440 [Natronobacterium gregoryi SP2]SFJ44955.1 hypothetical protein SAMN05443661_13037 [Natronobacterium gregoryi]